MRILKKTGAVDSKMFTKKISPISARETLEENLRHEKANLKNRNVMDKTQVHKNIKKWQDALDNSCPEKLPPQVKSEMWKKAKRLKDEFTVGMLSTDELHPVRSFESKGAIQVAVNEDSMQSTNSVKRQVAWDKKMGDKVREYKNIMRHLNPDDPNATDIEKFRPTGRIK